MSRFIKVASWNNYPYEFGSDKYHKTPKIEYINIDLIKKFYRNEGSESFNFKLYSSEYQNYIKNPTAIITQDDEIYYSPIQLGNVEKMEEDDIESRFDIIDL